MSDILERLHGLADPINGHEMGELWNGLEEAVDEIERLRSQLEDIPEGCTPADAQKLRGFNHDMAAENDRLRSRLAELEGQEPKVISSPDLSLIIREVIRSNPVARGTLLSMKIAIAVSDALHAALDKHPAPPAVPEWQEPASASKYRRWNFEADDDGLLVCRGGHESSEHCEAHMERLSSHEALQIVNEMRADLLRLSARPAPPAADYDLWSKDLEERDGYHEWADRLADAIASHMGVDIGEHSNANNPWALALEALETAPQREGGE